MTTKSEFWIQASSKTTQRIVENDTPQVINIDKVDGAEGISLDPKTGIFTVENESDYLVVAAPQVGRSNAGNNANFRCWIRVNGENVPDSNVLLNLFHVDLKDVIVCQGLMHLNAGDKLEVIMATDNVDAGVGAEAIQPTPNEPLVPAIIFSMEAY